MAMPVLARHWHMTGQGRIQCDLCPRYCQLQDGQVGLCVVRKRQGDALIVQQYGRNSSLCIDPIEKKPLYHFFPGEPILSIGTLGCNLTCKFCQNWNISRPAPQNPPWHTLQVPIDGAGVARIAGQFQTPMVAFTYNEPTVFLEYAIETAQACHAQEVRTVAVTAGYITPEPRAELFRHIDAANIDLKSFREAFYRKWVGGHLQPVLDTLVYLKRETSVWLELTTLLIPGENDSDAELYDLTGWIMEQLGPDVPLHFSAFHPNWKMTSHPPTPPATLMRARQIARQQGLRHVYCGNLPHDRTGSQTRCHRCDTLLIARMNWEIGTWALTADGRCPNCQTPCAGHFASQPGRWGAKRLPLSLQA